MAQETAQTLTFEDCLDFDRGQETRNVCGGDVEYRMALSSSGNSFVRCDVHWEQRLDEQERISERYPDSDMAPADFDPTYAGERWNEDDY